MAGNRALTAIAAFVFVAVSVGSCGSGADDPAQGDGRTAAVYESILDWVLDDEPVGAGDGSDPVVFVAARSEEQIDLDVQVAVIEAFDSEVFVRFIDVRTEAVMTDADDQPVREDGMLIGLGAVAADGETVEVYMDRYRTAGDVDAWVVTLRRSGEVWELVGVPVVTEVRPVPAGT